MNLNRKHEAQNDRQPHANRERVEEMLRDIAFVLKMTQRLREEMEAEKEAEECVLA